MFICLVVIDIAVDFVAAAEAFAGETVLHQDTACDIAAQPGQTGYINRFGLIQFVQIITQAVQRNIDEIRDMAFAVFFDGAHIQQSDFFWI